MNYKDKFQTDVTFKNTGPKKRYVDYDKRWIDVLGNNVNDTHARTVLKRFQSDYQISFKHSPNEKEKQMWIDYWNKEK